MPLSAIDALNAFRNFAPKERRALFGSIVRDTVATEGVDETVQMLCANLFDLSAAPTEREIETVATLMNLPRDVAEAVVQPFDPNSIRDEDLLSDEEVERIISDKY